MATDETREFKWSDTGLNDFINLSECKLMESLKRLGCDKGLKMRSASEKVGAPTSAN